MGHGKQICHCVVGAFRVLRILPCRPLRGPVAFLHGRLLPYIWMWYILLQAHGFIALLRQRCNRKGAKMSPKIAIPGSKQGAQPKLAYASCFRRVRLVAPIMSGFSRCICGCPRCGKRQLAGRMCMMFLYFQAVCCCDAGGSGGYAFPRTVDAQ